MYIGYLEEVSILHLLWLMTGDSLHTLVMMFLIFSLCIGLTGSQVKQCVVYFG